MQSHYRKLYNAGIQHTSLDLRHIIVTGADVTALQLRLIDFASAVMREPEGQECTWSDFHPPTVEQLISSLKPDREKWFRRSELVNVVEELRTCALLTGWDFKSEIVSDFSMIPSYHPVLITNEIPTQND